jgi:hypothetical protein
MLEREDSSLPLDDGIRGFLFPIFVILKKLWFFPQKSSWIYNGKKLQKIPNLWLKEQ